MSLTTIKQEWVILLFVSDLAEARPTTYYMKKTTVRPDLLVMFLMVEGRTKLYTKTQKEGTLTVPLSGCSYYDENKGGR